MKYKITSVLLSFCFSIVSFCAVAQTAEVVDSIKVEVADTIVMDVVMADSAVIDSMSVELFIDSLLTAKLDTLRPYHSHQLFLPLVFERQEVIPYERLNVRSWDDELLELNVDTLMPRSDEWLMLAIRDAARVDAARNYVMINCPDRVKYNLDNLPEVPREYVIVSDPTKQTITIVEKPLEVVSDLKPAEVKIKRWKSTFNSAIQLSQVYISDNWYQGGQSSISLLSDQRYSLNYNDPTGNILFENLVQWKLNLTTSEADTVHKVRIGEELFQINSKFGYKAVKKWYYTASLQFKTQFLTNYATNSNEIQAEFLSPSELNVGVGMSYQHSYEKPVKLTHTITISPLSYNLKFLGLHHMDPTKFGIETGYASNEVGSSIDYSMTWNLRYNIQWITHLFAFTDYSNFLAEWTNTFDFSFSTYFSARVYVDVRYDNSVAPDPKLGHFQIKELLSIGFAYKL